MKIYIDMWNCTYCMYLLPTIYICNNYNYPWWRISRISIGFIKARIEIVFD